MADRIQSTDLQLQWMCLAAQYLVLRNSLAAQKQHQESKRCNVQFPPNIPQDWSPSSNTCSLKEECDVFYMLLSKKVSSLNSLKTSSRWGLHNSTQHSEKSLHCKLLDSTLNSPTTFSRNTTLHISPAFGERTFTGHWTIWKIVSVMEKLRSLNENENQWTIK